MGGKKVCAQWYKERPKLTHKAYVENTHPKRCDASQFSTCVSESTRHATSATSIRGQVSSTAAAVSEGHVFFYAIRPF